MDNNQAKRRQFNLCKLIAQVLKISLYQIVELREWEHVYWVKVAIEGNHQVTLVPKHKVEALRWLECPYGCVRWDEDRQLW